MALAPDRAAESGPEPVVELARVFAAPPEHVFAAWTEADALAAWMGPGDTSMRVDALDLTVDGAYRFVMEGDEGEYPLGGRFLEIDPPKRLVFTWAWERGDYAAIETVVELAFTPTDGGTELTLVHRRLSDDEARDRHAQGWTGCLDCLAEYLAT